MSGKKGFIIIPARGGSKGIKNKNIVDACGKPLIYYTINSALRVKKHGLIDAVIVSTDSQKIADISKKLGADVPFLRPENISGDTAKSIDFMLHAIKYFEKKNIFYDYTVLLQPTSPLRSSEDIIGAINLFKNGKSDSLISVCREERVDETELYYKKDNIGMPLSPSHNKGIRRQDLKPLFIRNAAIYITSTKYLKEKRRVISENPLLFEMPQERSLDIDTKEDLRMLRKILI
jgi:N-acylneuraminate cytidylyltransferase/CMP-N,N'-diacetyllegionaminic acid synthase